MTRISKYAAQQIAEAALANRETEVEAAKEKAQEKVTEAVRATVPAEVLEFYAKYPDWTNSACNFHLTANGVSESWESSSEDVPYRGSQYVTISSAHMKEWATLKKSYESKKKQLKIDREELEIAIFNLRTYEKVRKELPTLAQYLPASDVVAVVPSLDRAREILKSI